LAYFKPKFHGEPKNGYGLGRKLDIFKPNPAMLVVVVVDRGPYVLYSGLERRELGVGGRYKSADLKWSPGFTLR
jgi:hypothetical protein